MNTEEFILFALAAQLAISGYMAFVIYKIAQTLASHMKQITTAGLPDDDDDEDDLFEEAKAMVRAEGKCSTSLLQRKYRIGYGRAARLIDLLAEEGVVEWSYKPSPGRWVVTEATRDE